MVERSSDRLAVQASVSRAPDASGHVQVRLVIRNPANHPASVQLSSHCPVRLRVSGEAGEPVWDETKERACPFAARVLELSPGQSETILHTLDVQELRGRGVLRPGRYSLTALVPWDLTVRVLDAGEFEVQS